MPLLRVLTCVTQEHNLWLLLLAAAICAITSISAFLMLGRASARGARLGLIWALSGGLTAGVGVWSTHFVAMTAYDVGLPLGFAPLPLFGSLAISIFAQVAMFLLAHQSKAPAFKMLAGAGAGVGISAMHYVGMAGLQAQALMLWDSALVWASVFLGVGLAAAAVGLFYHLERKLRAIWAGVVFVLAICGLHFTAMGALTLVPVQSGAGAPEGLPQQLLGIVVGFGAFLFVVIAMATALADAYLSDRQRLENIRLRQNVEERTKELVFLAREQTLLREKAEEANAAKSQFLANMSHELRTPLNAIIGYGEIILEDIEPDAPIGPDVTRIIGAAKHLLVIINDVLDLSKIDAGRAEVEAAEYCLGDIAHYAIETIRPQAVSNRNTLTLDLSADLGDCVGDAFKLKQCLINLLANAVKFTSDGAVTLRVRREPSAGHDWLVLEVVDTGIGMSPEQIARLFQPFAQADPSVTRRYGGTGLGLAITQRLTRLLGGDVTVTSAEGAGSTFTLRVPADITQQETPEESAAEVNSAPDERPLILLVEDDPDARNIIKRTLEPLGFAVWATASGDRGLRKSRETKPALMLLDLNLSGKSGWTVLDELQDAEFDQRPPVVVVSSESERESTLRRGAAEHLVKPINRNALIETVLRFARNRPESAPVPAQGAA